MKQRPEGAWFKVEPGSLGEATLSKVCTNSADDQIFFGDFDTMEDAAKATRKVAKERGLWK